MGKRLKKIKQRSSNYRTNNISLVTDITVLFTVLLLLAVVVFDMFVDRNRFVNLLCTLGTLLLLMIVYFIGIVPALSINVIMTMSIVIYSIYQYVNHGVANPMLFFWVLIPTLLCLACYMLSRNITKLQDENRLIKAETQELSTVDEETHLRTSAIYKDHFEVFSTLARERDFPLYLYVTQIRYWNAVSGMLSKKDRQELILLISNIIDQAQSGHEFVYYIDNNPPTWAVLSTINPNNPQVINNSTSENKNLDIKRIFKQTMYDEIQNNPNLRRVSIQIAMSHVVYNTEEHPDATTFLSDAIHELQYDV